MKTDSEVKTDVEAELRWSPEIDETDIATKVKMGVVTLTGFVQINGVSGVTSAIRIKPTVSTGDIKHKIEDAFRRSATIDASHVTVDADGSEVILRGEVRSWAERDQAQASAWSAPGVTQVRNELSVRI